jgi:hypothetical protein
VDYAAEAKRHRHMAEVYLAMVDHTPHDDLRTHYRKLAKVYNALADNEDRIASNLKLAN